jgi:hypothetical protein
LEVILFYATKRVFSSRRFSTALKSIVPLELCCILLWLHSAAGPLLRIHCICTSTYAVRLDTHVRAREHTHTHSHTVTHTSPCAHTVCSRSWRELSPHTHTHTLVCVLRTVLYYYATKRAFCCSLSRGDGVSFCSAHSQHTRVLCLAQLRTAASRYELVLACICVCRQSQRATRTSLYASCYSVHCTAAHVVHMCSS